MRCHERLAQTGSVMYSYAPRFAAKQQPSCWGHRQLHGQCGASWQGAPSAATDNQRRTSKASSRLTERGGSRKSVARREQLEASESMSRLSSQPVGCVMRVAELSRPGSLAAAINHKLEQHGKVGSLGRPMPAAYCQRCRGPQPLCAVPLPHSDPAAGCWCQRRVHSNACHSHCAQQGAHHPESGCGAAACPPAKPRGRAGAAVPASIPLQRALDGHGRPQCQHRYQHRHQRKCWQCWGARWQQRRQHAWRP